MSSHGNSSHDKILKLRRELPSTLTAYHNFVQEILDELKQRGWSEQLLFGVLMALEETISNAVRHGNKEDAHKRVNVDCELSAQRFWARICDEGEGYNPDAIPDCCQPENLEAAGGRGLKLIRAYMTSVTHSKDGRCVEIEKLLEGPDGGSPSD